MITKAYLLSFSSVALLSIAAMAAPTQETSKMPRSSVSTRSAVEGFQVSLIKPDMTFEAKLSEPAMTITDSFSRAGGLSLGYAYLPVREIGFTAGLTYINLGVGNSGIASTAANLGYAMTPIVNIKGGLNVSRITGSSSSDSNAGLGYQIAMGFQVTEIFGIDLGYSVKNQSWKYENTTSTVNIQERSPELALTATF